ncbi:MAG: hypothetical protein PW791_17680 [Neorhizobium sp.]|jgi:hypothetical protein|nr:hypothetical protein [Neorhizobium sp.]
MPNRDPLPTPEELTPRGPVSTGGVPDRTQEKPARPPVQDTGDTKNPQDPVLDPAIKPALMPIGDPASMA